MIMYHKKKTSFRIQIFILIFQTEPGDRVQKTISSKLFFFFFQSPNFKCTISCIYFNMSSSTFQDMLKKMGITFLFSVPPYNNNSDRVFKFLLILTFCLRLFTFVLH